MPAPGDQHISGNGEQMSNLFEGHRHRLSEYTAREIATLQSRLEKQLGPEYISSRAGPGGNKIHYVTSEKCIQLANEIFGFNGWSTEVRNMQVDFVDENPNTGKVSLGLSVIVRVTLRDGTFHEDVGYGHIENCKGKAAAFEKAKKEGTTDAMKRALRNFGNVLGNCLYDKDYITKVVKIKVAPTRWDINNLHRSAANIVVKKDTSDSGSEEVKTQIVRGAGEDLRQNNAVPELVSTDSFDEDFGEFDDADFGAGGQTDLYVRPDEVLLPGPTRAAHNGASAQQNQSRESHVQLQVPNRGQRGLTEAGGPNGEISVVVPVHAVQQSVPQTPGNRIVRSTSVAGPMISTRPHPGAPPGPPRVLHQPSRMAMASAPASPQNSSTDNDQDSIVANNSIVPGPVAFFSAKAAIVTDGSENTGPIPPSSRPAFNPHAESPSIRKTPGVDHSTSKPVNRELKHVPGNLVSVGGAPAIVAAPGAPPIRSNIIDPRLDGTRRIGVPQSPGSPMSNRGAYKPPTMKRASDGTPAAGRTPLVDISAQHNMPTPVAEHETKRVKMGEA